MDPATTQRVKRPIPFVSGSLHSSQPTHRQCPLTTKEGPTPGAPASGSVAPCSAFGRARAQAKNRTNGRRWVRDVITDRPARHHGRVTSETMNGWDG
jgi:hypothetical protein